MSPDNKPQIKEHLYYVKGMHCASCEVLIEKKLLELAGIKSVEAKAAKGEVLIEYVGERPKTETLNSLFKKENYLFSNKPFEEKRNKHGKNLFVILVISLLLIAAFLFINKSGLAALVSVNSKSSLPAFFFLGLIAGISSCAALVGGMVLSMSKQWLAIYSEHNSVLEKLQPHLMFNAGRIVSYAILGAILGVIGSKLQISLQFTSFLIITVSIIMLFLALQMLGVKSLRRFQPTLPKFATRYIADETNFKGRYMPFIMGALTFFLPCGFTITSQGLALLSGNPVQGGLIMAFFALRTAPALLLIGFSAVKVSTRPHLTYQFSKVAGILILFFAFFNLNNQLNILGVASFSDLTLKSVSLTSSQGNDGFASIIDGKQVLKMDAYAAGYSPNYFKVKAGIPVRWEITDAGTSGCTNAVISQGLFSDEINLTPGQTSVKEFTPAKAGKYKFSCWMGMISGIIEVIDQNDSAETSITVSSGAQGCSCGCGIK